MINNNNNKRNNKRNQSVLFPFMISFSIKKQSITSIKFTLYTYLMRVLTINRVATVLDANTQRSINVTHHCLTEHKNLTT